MNAETAFGGKVEQYLALYMQLRAELDELKRKYEEACEEKKAAIDKLNNFFLNTLDKLGATSIKTKLGTCVASTRYTASLSDADAFMRFVLDHKAYDLLERRANSTAVKDFIQEKGVAPPGVNLNALRTFSFRKA